jgi:glutamate synthase domain-containing protein 3
MAEQATLEGTIEIDCADQAMRDINRGIRTALENGMPEVVVRNPGARHNLAVGIRHPGRIVIDGSAGYYCGGLCNTIDLEVRGSAGWGLAENLMDGRVVVHGNAGNSAGASIHGGTIVVHGHAGARTGIAMKGGTLIVGGNTGYMTGFMMQKGTMIICGNADEGLGDSMYEGRIFVGGEIANLGNDAVVEELTDEDRQFLDETLDNSKFKTQNSKFKKVVSGKQLYNFNKKDFARWRHAL